MSGARLIRRSAGHEIGPTPIAGVKKPGYFILQAWSKDRGRAGRRVVRSSLQGCLAFPYTGYDGPSKRPGVSIIRGECPVDLSFKPVALFHSPEGRRDGAAGS